MVTAPNLMLLRIAFRSLCGAVLKSSVNNFFVISFDPFKKEVYISLKYKGRDIKWLDDLRLTSLLSNLSTRFSFSSGRFCQDFFHTRVHSWRKLIFLLVFCHAFPLKQLVAAAVVVAKLLLVLLQSFSCCCTLLTQCFLGNNLDHRQRFP